jgi:drug/metabolite transporter (DMT)-like permease
VLVTVVGTLLYHIAQKTMPRAVSPFVLLAASFSLAALICVAALLITVRPPFGICSAISWSSVALGAAMVTIETGYLMAYRIGWRLNRAAFCCNITVAVLLIPLGMILFREQISLRMLAGSSLCIVGLILLVR